MDAQTRRHFTFLGAVGSPLLRLLHATTYPRQKEMHRDQLRTLLALFRSPFAGVLGDFPRKGQETSRVRGQLRTAGQSPAPSPPWLRRRSFSGTERDATFAVSCIYQQQHQLKAGME